MKDCMGKDANWECLTKDTYVRMYDKFKLVRKLLLESSGPICIPEEKGLFIVYGKVSARYNLSINKEVTQELKTHVGQGHCFLDEIIIDTGKMNEITGGDICPGQQKLLTIEYITVCDKVHITPASNIHPSLTRYVEEPGTLNPVWRLKRPCFVKEPIIAKDPCISRSEHSQPRIIPENCYNRQLYIIKEPHTTNEVCVGKTYNTSCKELENGTSCVTTETQNIPCEPNEYVPEPCFSESGLPKHCLPEPTVPCGPCKSIRKKRKRKRQCAKANELCVIRDPCEVPCKVKKKKPPCAPKKRCVKKHPANKKNMLLFPLFPIHGAYIYPLAPKC